MSASTTTSSSPAATSSGSRDDTTPPMGMTVTVFIIAIAVIIAIFGGCLTVGIIRRRRNPERYGPRPAIPGRARQTKKKGLAMAVLESIPVIRFGANNKTSEDPTQKDVELAEGMGDDESIASRNRGSREIPANTETEISQPPASHLSSTKNVQLGAGTECSICIADFVESEEVRVLPCSHRFHPACIDPWLLNVSGTCPICRYDLQPAQPEVPAEEVTTEGATTASPAPVTTPTPAATLQVPSPTVATPRDRASIGSRLREIRQAHSGAEYTAALRRLYHDRELRRPRSVSHTEEAARPT